MNILVATSRGRDLNSLIPTTTHKVTCRVYPGAGIPKLTSEATKILQNPAYITQDTHIYIMGGINDITEKLKGPNYTEIVYTHDTDETANKVINYLETCSTQIRTHGAKAIFTTLTSCDIAA